jgi:hypothetical protein
MPSFFPTEGAAAPNNAPQDERKRLLLHWKTARAEELRKERLEAWAVFQQTANLETSRNFRVAMIADVSRSISFPTPHP